MASWVASSVVFQCVELKDECKRDDECAIGYSESKKQSRPTTQTDLKRSKEREGSNEAVRLTRVNKDKLHGPLPSDGIQSAGERGKRGAWTRAVKPPMSQSSNSNPLSPSPQLSTKKPELTQVIDGWGAHYAGGF